MPSAYPDAAAIGQKYLKYTKLAPDYDAITVQVKFEDGGVDFNTSAATAPQVYEFLHDGLTPTQAAVLDAHYASCIGQVYGFNFTPPRDDVTGVAEAAITDGSVHYLKYEVGHNKYWVQSRKVVLIRRIL